MRSVTDLLQDPKTIQGLRKPPLGLAFQLVCTLAFRVYAPLKVTGREHLPDGPFMICSNHESHIDSGALMVATGRPFDQLAMLAAKDYFFDQRRFVSLLMRLIPLSRKPDANLSRSIRTARDFLDRTNGVLIMYPEGTRSQSGEIGPFKPGAGLFAARLGVPIVPALISGTRRLLPKGRVMVRPGPVKVSFGPPVFAAGGHADDADQPGFTRNLIADVEKRVHALKNGEGVL